MTHITVGSVVVLFGIMMVLLLYRGVLTNYVRVWWVRDRSDNDSVSRVMGYVVAIGFILVGIGIALKARR